MSTKYDVKNGDGDTFRDRAEMAGAGGAIPDATPPDGADVYMDAFWGSRSFLSGPESAMRPSDVREYSELSGALLDKRDIGIILAMDRAFREQYPKTVAAHNELKSRMKGN